MNRRRPTFSHALLTSFWEGRGRPRRGLAPWLRAAVAAASTLAAGAWSSPAWAEDPTAAPSRGTTERVAVVIGTNDTTNDEQAPLRFADDDAARMAELLTEAGVEVELLTRFDGDSQARFPRQVARAHRPSRTELDAALARTAQRVAAIQARGHRAELLVYYSGHGDVGPDGQGFLALEGGKLTRRFLFEKIVGASRADKKHLIIDACRSEELVAPRGKTWKPDRAAGSYGQDVAQYLQRTQLTGHADTGVVLAASADQQTHEWERYQGGIFTHQVLSGLRGGADLNGDGRIEYSELGAFVSSANSAVNDPRARLGVFVHAPREDQRAPMLVHDDIADQRTLLFVGDDRRHYAIEDDRGVRIADLRRAGPSPTYLRLPSGPVFVSRSDVAGAGAHAREEARIASDASGPIFVARLDFNPSERRSRGALDEAFRAGLFRVPYGQGYYAGYTDQTGMLAVEEPEWEVRVWQRVDGEMVEVARVEGQAPRPEGPQPGPVVEEVPPPPGGPPRPEKVETTTVTVEESAGDAWRRHWGRYWGGFSFAPELNPFSPDGDIRFQPKRVIANDFRGLQGNGVMRGFDARWWGFSAKDPRDYPRGEWYFRTGYTEGEATMGPRDEMAGYEPTDATRLEYFTVPLFLGGNIYVVKRFPVRPFAGAGFGFDVLDLTYTRPDGSIRTDTSARIGFELHAGVDIRITNYVSLVGEVRQLWSAQRKIPRVPNFSNEGLTVVTALRFNLPLHRRDRSVSVSERRRVTTTVERTTSTVEDDAPAEQADRADAAPPGPGVSSQPSEPSEPSADAPTGADDRDAEPSDTPDTVESASDGEAEPDSSGPGLASDDD